MRRAYSDDLRELVAVSILSHRSCRDWILGQLDQEKDLTMRALVNELGVRGIVTSERSVQRCVADAGLLSKDYPVSWVSKKQHPQFK